MALIRASILLMVVAAGCAPKPAPPVEAYGAGGRDAALEAQAAEAAVVDRDQTLDRLRLASMAYALGEDDRAREALRPAVQAMTDFRADGEFAAQLVREDKKEWKGEPYEKMAAFTMMGTLLWQQGERGNALAMYKSAVLADTGSVYERFRSDFVPGWVLQALVYQAEGERDNAEQFMARGVDALWSRRTVDALTAALRETRPAGPQEEYDAARAAVVASLAAGVSARPRDPVEAAEATVALAPDLLEMQRETPRKERLPSLAQFSGADFDLARRGLPRFRESWLQQVHALPPTATADGPAFAEAMDALLATPPNLVLVIERGQAPRKVRSGDYGELLTILPNRRAAIPPGVTLDGQGIEALFLDDLYYQATTRGGRRVDAFLRGKAVYKDASLISGYVALRVAEIAHYTDNDELAAVAGILGAVLTVSSLVTNPAADIRQWEHAPGGWFLVAGTVPPGAHEVRVGGRSYTVTVPEHGQVVHLVPQLPPGGRHTIP